MRSPAGPVDRGVVKSARSGSAVSVARARQLRLFDQLCAWCDRPVLASRVDARYCSTRCRQAAYRAGVRRAELAATAAPLRLAYADPPYRGQPGYAGEVDLEELLTRLASFDGWALSTSAEALPAVLAVAVARGLDVRVAAWMRSARPHATARLLNGGEPVVFAGARQLPGSAPQAVDALVGCRSSSALDASGCRDRREAHGLLLLAVRAVGRAARRLARGPVSGLGDRDVGLAALDRPTGERVVC